MDKVYARIISIVLEPFILLLLLVFVLVVGKPPSVALAGLLLVVLGLGAPVAVYLWEYFHNKSDELEPGRKDRNNIYLAGTFSFSFVSILFGSVVIQSSEWFFLSMIMAVYMALMYLVNLYFDKASFHISTYTFVVTIIMVQLNPIAGILLALLPFLIWARLTLHKHTWVEILWGLAIGLGVGVLTWAI